MRCANCRHSWFQDPHAGRACRRSRSRLSPPRPAPCRPSRRSPRSRRSVRRPRGGPDAPRARLRRSQYAGPAARAAPDYDAFAHRPPFRPRRNHAAALDVARGARRAADAGRRRPRSCGSARPDCRAASGPAHRSRPKSPLRLRDNPIERRELENGSELFAVSGQVINPVVGAPARARHPRRTARCAGPAGLQLDDHARSSGRWHRAATLDFNSAKLDVPANSKRLELSFAGDGGA